MSTQVSKTTLNDSIWRAFPLIGTLHLKWQNWRREERQPHYRLALVKETVSEFPPYAVDMWPLLDLPFGRLDEAGVLYNDAKMGYPALYHPTTIAQYALAHWNAYIATDDIKHQEAFMIQANWLVEHESRLADDRGGWPMPFPLAYYNASTPWLSALTQGNCISVLVRAYDVTDENIFLEVARRAIRTFDLDISQGGVSSSIADKGVFFFEEVAVCPPAHVLNGYLLALFGLYDYVALTGDDSIHDLIQRSFAVFLSIMDEFDTGYWSYYDLRFKGLAPRFYHALHITLLEALARYTGNEQCAALAERWKRYQQSFLCRMRYLITVLVSRAYRVLHKV
jgi:heparosan-N-sulfate-glucuronate 5-epimerase